MGRSANTIVRLVLRGIARHEVFIRAAALTYVSILTLVPTLAVAFAIFTALGGVDRARDTLLPRLLDYLAVGTRDTVEVTIQTFLANIRGGTIGTVGILFLVMSVGVLLSQIELAFTRIWETPRGRSVPRRIAVYWTVVTFTPALLLGSMWIYARASRLAPVAWLLALSKPLLVVVLPYALVCLGIGLLYVFVPNQRVSARAAVAGALVAGALWSAAAYGYAFYAHQAVFYSRIYGSLGALPILLLWLYLSWVIVLVGAEVTVACEHVMVGADPTARERLSPRGRELLALRLLSRVARRYLDGSGANTPLGLSRELAIEPALAAALATDLIAAGLVLETSDRKLVPARDPARIAPGDAIESLRRLGDDVVPSDDAVGRELAVLQRRAETAMTEAWGGRTLAELVS